MNKPGTVGGYKDEVTRNCERVLVTLLRGLGPWKNSVYLVGGLTPRYLVKARPPDVPVHAGTSDVDIVVELQMLADTDAYYSLEKNFRKLGFERAENHKGEKVSWRWRVNTESGMLIILELLADDPEIGGGKVQPLPTAGNISALNIPHASMVFDHHETREISVELLGEGGVATETIRYADLVSFTCLKAFAFDQRNERKDAYDLIYCLENYDAGLDAAAEAFRVALEGPHKAVIETALAILIKRFVDCGEVAGYTKDGPVAVAKFELSDNEEIRERRILRQRDVSDLIARFVHRARKGVLRKKFLFDSAYSYSIPFIFVRFHVLIAQKGGHCGRIHRRKGEDFTDAIEPAQTVPSRTCKAGFWTTPRTMPTPIHYSVAPRAYRRCLC